MRIKVWTLTVDGPNSKVIVTSVHPTEDAALEHLRETEDPHYETVRQDESIMELTEWGYVIYVDVHEVEVPGAILVWDCPDPECFRTEIPETEAECPTCGMANPSVVWTDTKAASA
jgi:hypothetical protein